MGNAANELSDQDFLHSYMADYLDGELPKELAERFQQILQTPGHQELPEHFQAMRGRLQLLLQSYYLKDAQYGKLRSLVQDPTIQATKEHISIDQIGRKEFKSTLIRRVVLFAFAVSVVGGLVWKFMPRDGVKFKPLEYLGYEALAMEEDPKGRLELPEHDMRLIRQYLESYPGLKFKPRILQSMPEDWAPEGATIIDYEVAKVAVIQYGNDTLKEKLFHFSYAGELSDLPAAEPGNMRGLVYQTYASDDLNVIAWQHGNGVVSLLVGRRAAPELAELVIKGGGK